MATISRTEAAELLLLLRERLEIPQNVRSLTLRLSVDALTEIECTYHPAVRERGNPPIPTDPQPIEQFSYRTK